MSTRIGSTVLDIDGMDPTSAAEVQASLRKFYSAFPRAAATISHVKLCDSDYLGGWNVNAFTEPLRSNPASGTWQDGYCIALNRFAYGAGQRAAFELDMQHYAATGWVISPKPAIVFEHELGHVVDMYAAHGDKTRMPSLGIKYHEALSVSEYGAKAGPAEVFADVFAGWFEGMRVGNARVLRILSSALDVVRAA